MPRREARARVAALSSASSRAEPEVRLGSLGVLTTAFLAALVAACSSGAEHARPLASFTGGTRSTGGASGHADGGPGLRDAAGSGGTGSRDPGDAAPGGGGGAGGHPGLDAGRADGAAREGGVAYDGVRFTEMTTAAGIGYVQNSDWSCVPVAGQCDEESPRMSGGAAAADVDGDGLVDLFATSLDSPCVLYRNRGDGTFEEIGAAAGVAAAAKANGAAFADIDNDGDEDLYVTTQGLKRHYLFVNDGTGHFTERGVERGAALWNGFVHEGTSIAFGDYDRDGWLDIHVNEWLPVTQGTNQSNVRLLHNVGGGQFADVTDTAGVVIPTNGAMGVTTFTSSFSDLDDDGWPDLAIAADFGTSRLFWNQKNGTFVEGTTAAGVGTDENGMGSAIGDYDGDGLLDWFVTSIYDPTDTCKNCDCSWKGGGNRLYKNAGGRKFTDATDLAGVRNDFWGWGASFFDYDGDGDLDLIATNGYVFPRAACEDQFNDTPMRLWRNDGANMTEVGQAAGLAAHQSGKGMVLLDYDGDGDQDVFVAENGTTPRLYRNDGGNASGWLRVRLVGTSSPRDPLGARVTVRASAAGPAMVRELRGGASFLSSDEPALFFGLGQTTGNVAEVRIRWPRSGSEQVLTDVARNKTLTVTEP